MARKRSLKDVAAEQLVEKEASAAEEATPVVAAVKPPNAGRKKKAAARKRSLKDAAADQLVEKETAVPEDPVTAIETQPAEPVAAAEPERVDTKPLFDDPTAAIEGPQKGRPSLKWLAILLLVGFAAGFFFGVGRGVGPANAAFILFGFAGGYLYGQFYKIF